MTPPKRFDQRGFMATSQASLPAVAVPSFESSAAASTRARQALLLFWKDWDVHALAQSNAFAGGRVQTHQVGFDLFSFPSNAQLMWFSAVRMLAQLERKYRRRIDAVISNDEQYGALIAAVLAQRLGLPGNDPRAVVACQHKWESRRIQQAVAPESVPKFCVFPYDGMRAEQVGLPYPFFVKPLKATFSVLARQVDSFDDLREHMRLKPFEQHIIRRLIKPFNELCELIAPSEVDAAWLIGEECASGHQLNVDGYVFGGNAQVLGIVDAWMCAAPDDAVHRAPAFKRFQYPTHLPQDAQARCRALVEKVVLAHGFTHGMFNMELFWHEELAGQPGEFTIIEINPRLASQVADFYLHVDGVDLYAMQLALALGQDPAGVPRRLATAGTAASCVWRSFDASSCPRVPTESDLRWLKHTFAGAQLHVFAKKASQLDRELKWLGSHRWAVLNIAARDNTDLQERYHAVARRMGWGSQW